MKPHRQHRCPNFAELEDEARTGEFVPTPFDQFQQGMATWRIIPDGDPTARVACLRGPPAGMVAWRGSADFVRPPQPDDTTQPVDPRLSRLLRILVGISVSVVLAAIALATLAGGTSAPAATVPKPPTGVIGRDDLPTGLLALQPADDGEARLSIDGGWIAGTSQ